MKLKNSNPLFNARIYPTDLISRLIHISLGALTVILFTSACESDDNSETKSDFKDSLDSFFHQSDPQPLVFTNVSVITMTSNDILNGQDVFITDGKIEAIVASGSKEITNFTEVDGSGKYLMPGLADMHIHPIVSENLRYDLFLFLAKGVTTVRVMWGFDGHIELRDKINTGDIFGPTVYVASAGFDGSNKSWPGAINTYSVSDVKSYIDEYSAKNYDFIKIYSGINATQYTELIAYAWEKGIPPIGHVPNSVDVADALSKQHSISHLGKFLSSSLNDADLYANLANSTTAVCPTLTVMNRIRGQEASYTGDWYQFISPEAREFYDETAHTLVSTDAFAIRVSKILKEINDSGGKIIAGSDMGIRFVLPGTSLHEELEHYVSAGISPYQTLQTATVNPANFMSDDLAGQLTVGNKADLVLLNANPLSNISSTQDIAGVMKSGRWISKEEINEVLTWIKGYYE